MRVRLTIIWGRPLAAEGHDVFFFVQNWQLDDAWAALGEDPFEV